MAAVILGIGVDVVEVDRVRQALSRRPRLAERLFTPQEIAYCRKGRHHRFSRFAARFAAKEALLKALGIGLRQVKWAEAEVVPDRLGKPTLRLHGKLAALAGARGVARLLLSISHTRDYAVAQVLAEGDG